MVEYCHLAFNKSIRANIWAYFLLPLILEDMGVNSPYDVDVDTMTESKENKYFFMEVKGFDLLEVLEKSPKIECQVKFLPTGK